MGENKSKFNYHRDKAKYVTFKDGRPKEKLRKFVTDAANHLTAKNKLKFSDNRNTLIKGYNEDGITGVFNSYANAIKDFI